MSFISDDCEIVEEIKVFHVSADKLIGESNRLSSALDNHHPIQTTASPYNLPYTNPSTVMSSPTIQTNLMPDSIPATPVPQIPVPNNEVMQMLVLFNQWLTSYLSETVADTKEIISDPQSVETKNPTTSTTVFLPLISSPTTLDIQHQHDPVSRDLLPSMPNTSVEEKTGRKLYQCPLCNIMCTRLANHLRSRKHRVTNPIGFLSALPSYKRRGGKIDCKQARKLCSICNVRVVRLDKHLMNAHKINLKEKKK